MGGLRPRDTWVFGFDTVRAELLRGPLEGKSVTMKPKIVNCPDITQLEVMDWNNDGAREVVVRAQEGVWVADWEFVPFYYCQFPSSTGPGANLI